MTVTVRVGYTAQRDLGRGLYYGSVTIVALVCIVFQAIWLVAFVASVLLGLDLGLLVALGFAILSVIYRTQRY